MKIPLAFSLYILSLSVSLCTYISSYTVHMLIIISSYQVDYVQETIIGSLIYLMTTLRLSIHFRVNSKASDKLTKQ